MTQEQMLSGLKKDVRSLLISAKLGLAPDHLKRDYLNMVGHPLPLRPLGFRNVLDMIKEMPDVVYVDYLGDGSLVLKAVVDESTRGIGELVARQRNAKSNKSSAQRGGTGFFSPRYKKHSPMVLPRRGHAPLALPAQLRAQLRQLLSQGPVGLSELEAGFARRFGHPLRVTNYGFYSIAEMLAAAADLVAIKQSRTGSLLTLKVAPAMVPLASQVGVPLASQVGVPVVSQVGVPVVSQVGVPVVSQVGVPVVSQVTTAVRTGQIKPPLPQQTPSTGTFVRLAVDTAPVEKPSGTPVQNHKASVPEDPVPNSSGGHQDQGGLQMEYTQPEPQLIQEGQLFQKCVIKLEEELRQRILENGHAGTVSPELKANLRQVVAQNSEGVSIHDLPAEYKRVFGEELPVAQSGFLSVTEMVGALSDTLYLRPVGGDKGHHWMITDIKHTGHTQPGAVEPDSPSEQGEGLNPSSQGYYFSCGESPWEDRREGEDYAADDSDLKSETELRIATKTFQQMVDMFPAVQVRSSPGKVVPLDALRGQRLRAPTRRGPRELVAVLVEHVDSPSNFYIRFDETQEARALENMMIEMRSCYTCPELSERYCLPTRFVRQGQVCCVAPRDMWFYRVIIHRILSQAQVEVYYVDFGDLTTVDRTSLKFLKSCYSELPAQAVPSSLTGIKPMGGSWSSNAISSFQKLCCERTLVAALHSYHADFLQVFLCDTHTEEDVYIHRALQGQGHGLSCPPAVNSVLCDQFNPVTLYLGEGVFDEGMEVDMDVDQTPEPCTHTPGTPQGRSSPFPILTDANPAVGSKAKEEEKLPDLPELEFIEVTEVNLKAQANPFGALLAKDSLLNCSDWDQGWTPDPPTPEVVQHKAAQDLGYHRDTTKTLKPPPPSASVKVKQQPCHGYIGVGVPPLPHIVVPPQPPILRTLSLHTPGLMQTQSSPYGVCVPASAFCPPTPSFIFPLFGSGEVLHVRHPSPFSLGPSARLAAGAHLLNWYPHKMV